MVTASTNAPVRRAAMATGLLVGAALVLGAVFALVGELMRHTTGELRFMRDVDSGPTATLTEVSKALSVIGSQGVLVPATVVLCIVLLVRHEPRTAAFVAVSAAGGIGLSTAVKVIVMRPRPSLVHLVHVSSSSFPSGHATQTAAILPALAIGVAVLGVRRSVALTVAIAASLLIGTSRVLLGVHYPSDVIAGWLLGAAWVAVAYVALLSPPRR